LFVIAAGNVPEARLRADHLTVSDLEPVRDPAHAWNALTVGACTERAVIEAGVHDGWTPVASPGDLSPWSATGVTMSSKWPNKPDVVFEGGNTATDGQTFDGGVADLCLLSTFFQPIQKLFVLTNATSAATAQVARLGAVISAEYPTLWPETLRALIVHSAEWTQTMQSAIDGANGRQAIGALLHRYGFGKPALSRALRSAADALTLISQSVIHPYREKKTREMHLHRLP
jgi:Subtilase family